MEASMAMEAFDYKDSEAAKRMRSMFGPQQVDQQIRHAIQFCWMALPPEQQNVDEVEKHIRRILERALRDLRRR
jgi:BMFP domain-containing protein YqiC